MFLDRIFSGTDIHTLLTSVTRFSFTRDSSAMERENPRNEFYLTATMYVNPLNI